MIDIYTMNYVLKIFFFFFFSANFFFFFFLGKKNLYEKKKIQMGIEKTIEGNGVILSIIIYAFSKKTKMIVK